MPKQTIDDVLFLSSSLQQNMYDMPQQVIQPQMHQPYQAAEQNQQQQSHHQQQQPHQQQSYQTVIQNQTQPIQNVTHHQTHGLQQQPQHHQQTPNSNQNSQFDTFDSIKSAAPAQQSHANRYVNNIGYEFVRIALF